MSRAVSGLVIVNKPEGLTSQSVVNRVKRLFSVDKAGHTGTLDPLATGVLPVLIGRAVKASEFMLAEDKHYGATLLLGETRDTEDVTGELLTRTDSVPTAEQVYAAIHGFVGEIMQTPPMYSALKVGGRKLYELARSGVTVEREARSVHIYSIEASRLSEREYFLDVKCSKGTYIRTLCADIGATLGCGGVMKTLVRLSAAGYTLDVSHTLEELEVLTEEERLSVIRPTEEIFEKYPIVRLPDFFARLAHSGLEIYERKINENYPVGTTVRLYDKDGFFAVGEVRTYDTGDAIKPIRQFK
ncbi:MAG: tRNA pseudouridine(55) synthase TruB [Clostridia bacterium]|nr:tRNA pseudouridine(55) synthase TruB [Clostridia bacterium]